MDIRIAAMIRPDSAVRACATALEALKAIKKKYRSKVDIRVFGCSDEELDNMKESEGFAFVNAGALKDIEAAKLLAGADIFVDASKQHAFAFTVREARASGCAAELPGDCGSAEIVSAVSRLVDDRGLLDRKAAPAVKTVKEQDFTLGVLYLYYPDGQRYNKNKPINELKRIISRLPCKKTIIYINNASADGLSHEIANGEFEISGDNSSFEFSGWQKGIDFIKMNKLPCDMYLFVNDMFMHDSVSDRAFLDEEMLQCAREHKAVIGRKTHFPIAGEIMGKEVIDYIRTHLFMMPKEIIDELGSLPSIDRTSMAGFFPSTYDPDVLLFRTDAPLSAGLKDFIFAYLISRWNRKKPYTRENFDILKGKAAAILNSLMLSVRVVRLGYPLVSYKSAKALCSNPFWEKNRPFYKRLPQRVIHRYEGFLSNVFRKYLVPYHL